MAQKADKIPFTPYQKFVILVLALTLFTVVLDFMVMSPMGDMLMKSMGLSTAQFGIAVSAYAFSAGISGFLTASFADRFDRKKLLLFFYAGFIIGTIFCGLANNYPLLIAARIVTGIFGGVIGSIATAIIADLFDIHHRGRVMGFIQMGFGASQVLGIPISLYIAYKFDNWHMPFLMVAGLAIVIAILIFTRLKPVTKHLEIQQKVSPFTHLFNTIAKRDYRIGFLSTALLSIGGFMMMPFGTAFAVNNLRIDPTQLTKLFMVSGITSLVIMPFIGRLSDKIDKYVMFTIASAWMMVVVFFYTHLSVSPLWVAMFFNIVMMMGIMSRMVPAGALTTGIPDMKDRGAFMSINASLQQIAGGFAAAIGGMIVTQKDKASPLEHYPVLGYVTIGVSLLSIFLMYRVSVLVKKKLAEPKV